MWEVLKWWTSGRATRTGRATRAHIRRRTMPEITATTSTPRRRWARRSPSFKKYAVGLENFAQWADVENAAEAEIQNCYGGKTVSAEGRRKRREDRPAADGSCSMRLLAAGQPVLTWPATCRRRRVRRARTGTRRLPGMRLSPAEHRRLRRRARLQRELTGWAFLGPMFFFFVVFLVVPVVGTFWWSTRSGGLLGATTIGRASRTTRTFPQQVDATTAVQEHARSSHCCRCP